MSDTVKLIIEIPKEDYEWIQTHQSVTDYQTTLMLYKSIINSTPLDDVKAEITTYKDNKVIHAERNEMIDIVFEIIDKHISGKENE